MWVWAKELGGRAIYVKFNESIIVELSSEFGKMVAEGEIIPTLAESGPVVDHNLMTAFFASGQFIPYEKIITWKGQQAIGADGKPAVNIAVEVYAGPTGLPMEGGKGGVAPIQGQGYVNSGQWVEFALISETDPGFMKLREIAGDTKIAVAGVGSGSRGNGPALHRG